MFFEIFKFECTWWKKWECNQHVHCHIFVLNLLLNVTMLSVTRDDFLCCCYPLCLYSTMANVSNFNLDENEIFNEQSCVVCCLSCILHLVFLFVTNLKVFCVIVIWMFFMFICWIGIMHGMINCAQYVGWVKGLE